MTKTELVKDGAGGALAGLAAVGMTPNDFPLMLAILIGLIGGTMAAWARERQAGVTIRPSWLVLQCAAWLMIAVLVVALAEYPGLSVRWSGAVAAIAAFASREGLQTLHLRAVKEMEERAL